MRAARPVALALVAAATLLAGCGIAASTAPASVAPGTVGPAATVTAAVAQTRSVIAAALAASQIELEDAGVAYRTAEPPTVAGTPRAVYQATLPDDPDAGFIVVYEFRDAAAAVAAGHELAGYIGSGAGRVQFPNDARHAIRQLGTTLVFYTWAPSTSEDPRAATVADALGTIGIGFAPPR